MINNFLSSSIDVRIHKRRVQNFVSIHIEKKEKTNQFSVYRVNRIINEKGCVYISNGRM